jgi:hypothetical protein
MNFFQLRHLFQSRSRVIRLCKHQPGSLYGTRQSGTDRAVKDDISEHATLGFSLLATRGGKGDLGRVVGNDSVCGDVRGFAVTHEIDATAWGHFKHMLGTLTILKVYRLAA